MLGGVSELTPAGWATPGSTRPPQAPVARQAGPVQKNTLVRVFVTILLTRKSARRLDVRPVLPDGRLDESRRGGERPHAPHHRPLRSYSSGSARRAARSMRPTVSSADSPGRGRSEISLNPKSSSNCPSTTPRDIESSAGSPLFSSGPLTAVRLRSCQSAWPFELTSTIGRRVCAVMTTRYIFTCGLPTMMPSSVTLKS